MRTVYKGVVPSTFELAKERIGKGKDVCIVAKKQTAGRGTKGRSFSSEVGGVYLTVLKFFDGMPSSEAYKLMTDTAVGVCLTLEKFGLTPVIKWPNDIFVSDKKICGILTENVFSGDKVRCSLIGVGLNVSNPLPDDLKRIATTMAHEGKKVRLRKVITELKKNLSRTYPTDDYKNRVGYLGKRVYLIEQEKRIPVLLSGVTERGELVVEQTDGTKRTVCFGEVSLRLTSELSETKDGQ